MKKYHVTADVNNEKYGKGQLVAQLNESDFIAYANLSDSDKFTFLKDKGAQFVLDVKQLQDKDVANYKIQSADGSEVNIPSEPQTTRKMRININGKDTGWVDVNEETEAQYNEVLQQMNQMQEQFNQRFNHFFESFRPSGLLGGFEPPSLLKNFGADKALAENKESKTEKDSPEKEKPTES